MEQFCVIILPMCELLDWTSGPGVQGRDLRVQLPSPWVGAFQEDIGWGHSGPFICVVPDKQVVCIVLVRSP